MPRIAIEGAGTFDIDAANDDELNSAIDYIATQHGRGTGSYTPSNLSKPQPLGAHMARLAMPTANAPAEPGWTKDDRGGVTKPPTAGTVSARAYGRLASGMASPELEQFKAGTADDFNPIGLVTHTPPQITQNPTAQRIAAEIERPFGLTRNVVRGATESAAEVVPAATEAFAPAVPYLGELASEVAKRPSVQSAMRAGIKGTGRFVEGMATPENAAMLAALPLAPAEVGAAVTAHFGAQGVTHGAKQGQDLVRHWKDYTPHEREEKLADMVPNALMVGMPLAHAAARMTPKSVAPEQRGSPRPDIPPPLDVPPETPITQPAAVIERQPPTGELGLDRRIASTDVPTEHRVGPRRRDVVTRERWDTMTPDEQKAAYFTSDTTGLPNGRMFEAEHDPAGSHPHVGYYDLDDFKAMNTALTHEGVNQAVLPAVGDTMKEVAESMGGDVVPYHPHGDEFLFRAKTPEAGNEFVKRVNAELAEAVFTFQDEAGNVYERKGAGGSHGIGTDPVSAEKAADVSKAARKAAGLRAGLRDKPVPSGPAEAGAPADLGQTAERPGIQAEVVDVGGRSRPAVPYGQEAAPAAPTVAPRAAQPRGSLPGQEGGPGGVREDFAGGGREPATRPEPVLATDHRSAVEEWAAREFADTPKAAETIRRAAEQSGDPDAFYRLIAEKHELTPTAPEPKRAAAEGALRSLGGVPKLEFYDRPESMPAADPARDVVLRRSQSGGSIEAHYDPASDPKNPRVVFFTDAIKTPKRAAEVAWHEVRAHHRLPEMLGDSWNGVRDAIFRDLEQSVGKNAAEKGYGFDLKTEEGQRAAAEEYIATLAEREPQNLRERSVLRRVADAVRQWMLRVVAKYPGARRLGVKWSDQDVLALLARGDTADATGAAQAAEPAFSRSPDPDLRALIRRGDSDALAKTVNAGFAKALSESPGQQTIGRPELANPANDTESRRFVDTVDELRKRAGIPDKQTFDQWEAAADELVKDPAAVAKRVAEAARTEDVLSPVETRAAKKLIAFSVPEAFKQKSLDAIATAARMVSAYRDTGTPAARSLGARRDALLSPSERAALFMNEFIVRPFGDVAKRIANGDKKAERAHAREVLSIVDKLKENGIDITNVTKENLEDRRWLSKMFRIASAKKSTMGDRMYEWYISALLSGPLTHVKNTVGNTANVLWEYGLVQPLTAAAHSVTRTEGRKVSDLAPMYGAVGRGLARGARSMAEAFMTENDVLRTEVTGTPRQFTTKGDTYKLGPAIPGKFGRFVRTPLRALKAADEGWRGVIGEMEAAAFAHQKARELGLKGDELDTAVKDMTDDMTSAAWQDALTRSDYVLFQKELGTMGRSFLNWRSKHHIAGYLVPFVTTPVNIFKRGMEFTLPGATYSIYRAARSGSRSELVQAGTKGMIALGLTLALAEYMDSHPDSLTGTVAAGLGNRAERETMQRTGRITSVKVGSNRYNYGSVDPVAVTVATTVDMLNEIRLVSKEGKDPSTAVVDLFKHVLGSAEDKTYLQGMANIVDAAREPEGKLPALVGNTLAGFVPNLLRSTLRGGSDSTLETRTWGARRSDQEGESRLHRQGRRIAYTAVPSEGLPWSPKERVSPYGETTQRPGDSLAERLLSPLPRFDERKRDPAAQAIDENIIAYNRSRPSAKQASVLPPDKSFKNPETERERFMSDEEYEKFSRLAGRYFMEYVDGQPFTKPGYKLTEDDIKLIKSEMTAARKSARAELFDN